MEKLSFVEKLDIEMNPDDNPIMANFAEARNSVRRQSQMVMSFAVQKDLEMQLLAQQQANGGAINDDDSSKGSVLTSDEEDI